MSRSLFRSATPLLLVLSVWVVLACGLAGSLKADSHEASLATSGSVYLGLLDYQPGDPICQHEANRVNNPGFEDGIGSENGWIGAGECTFLEDDPGYRSPASVRILSEDPTKKNCKLLSLLTETPFEAGRFYDYSAWVKTNLLAGNAHLAITFWKTHHGTLKLVGEPPPTNLVLDTQGDWVKVTGSAQAPADADYVRVEATLAESSQGSVWFDDIYLGLSTCLNMSKDDDPNEVLPGSTLTYTIVYSNTGREKATDLRIVEEYDDNVQFMWAEPTPIADRFWEFDELPAGSQGVITAVVWVEDEAAGESWLINKVYGLSTEISRAVTYPLTTPIIPTLPCVIDLEVVDEAKTGRPGQTLNYDLILKNIGDCAGQCSLTAAPPPGWDHEFDPPTYTLGIGDAQPVTLTLVISDGASGGNSYSTPITATIECEPPCHDKGRDDDFVDTRIPVFLPLVMRDPHRVCWESEPNDRCSEADGPLQPCSECYGYTNDDRDLWKVLVPGTKLQVDLAIVPEALTQLSLVDADCRDVYYCYDDIPPYRLDCVVHPGLYFVDIWVANPISTYPPYTVEVTIPNVGP
jgi:uncharacterized repeat protein (TIGR01451 family)